MPIYTRYWLHFDAKAHPEVVVALEECCKDLRSKWMGPDTCTWYDHEFEMATFSRMFPYVLFKLEGWVDYHLDELPWIKYFKGGKVQRCRGRLSHEPYSPSLLTSVESEEWCE